MRTAALQPEVDWDNFVPRSAHAPFPELAVPRIHVREGSRTSAAKRTIRAMYPYFIGVPLGVGNGGRAPGRDSRLARRWIVHERSADVDRASTVRHNAPVIARLPVRRFLLLAGALAVAACAGRTAPFPTEVSGTVTYRERIALVPGTQLRVTLSETTRADAPAQFIAETTVPDVIGVPIPFRIAFDPRWVDPKLTYTLRARIEREGRVLFTNDAPVHVLTGGAPSRVEIVVVSVSGPRN